MGRLEEGEEMSWKGKSVLVTGANGFVGSWVAKALVEGGADVVALIRDLHPKYQPAYQEEVVSGLAGLVKGDITAYQEVARVFNEYGVEFCFHLAAQAIVGAANRSPLSTFETNIRGTWNILEAARSTGTLKGLVVASSDKAYGEHERLPYTEEFSLNGLNPYDASKACADILARTYAQTYEMPVAVARCANIYGGGDMNFSRIVPDTIRSLLQGREPVIRSDGTPVRDYMYIEDAVSAYLALAEKIDKAKGGAFNFGTNKPVTVLELVEKIIALSGARVRPIIQGKGRSRGEIQRQYLSSEKARCLLGWTPKYTLEEGLKETLDWYREYLSKSR